MGEPQTFQKYVIKRKLRSVGTYMDVYLAEQPGLGREVELRILGRPVAETSSDFKRFQREYQLLARLDHPAIIKILDLGRHSERVYYITSYRNAKSLEELLKETEGPFSIKEVVAIGLTVGDALRHMHVHGLIHRNLSTHTVFYDLDNLRAYVADFATLKGDEDGALSKSEIPFVYDSFFTPEQIFNRPIDRRTDLYLLGVTLYRLLTQEFPFDKKALLQGKLSDAFSVKPPALLNKRVSADLELVLMKLLEAEPENRFQSCEEYLQALELVRDGLRAEGLRSRAHGRP